MKSKLTTLFSIISLFFVSMPALGQDDAGGGDLYLEDSFRDVTIVGAVAVGGAVLGLSTLSFVDEPKDHLKNVVVGAAVGVIVGVALVAYMAATKSKGAIETGDLEISPDQDLQFATASRLNWHTSKHQSYTKKSTENSLMGYQFTF